MPIQFLNVDLELTSATALQPIVDAFGDEVILLHQDTRNGGHFASFETMQQSEDPAAAVERLCALAAGLTGEARSAWERCEKRVLDVGYESGDTPRCHHTALSPQALRQIAELGLSLAISIYPPAPDEPEPPA